MEGKYYINGTDVETLGLIILKSEGEIDLLKPKPRLTVVWPDEDGVDVDIEDYTHFEQREITLDCVLKASTSALLEAALKNIQDLLTGEGYKRFKSYKEAKRIHLVYLTDMYNFKRYNGGKLITFSIKLTEPQSVAKQFKIAKITQNTGDVTVSFTTDYPLDIYWGDSSKSLAQVSAVAHTYTFNIISLEYTLVVLGRVSSAINFGVTGTGVTITEEI